MLSYCVLQVVLVEVLCTTICGQLPLPYPPPLIPLPSALLPPPPLPSSPSPISNLQECNKDGLGRVFANSDVCSVHPLLFHLMLNTDQHNPLVNRLTLD